MKYTILFLLIPLQNNKQNDLREVNLFNRKFIFSIPKYLDEKKPFISTHQDSKYERRFFNKDSSIQIMISVAYKQLIGLSHEMNYEKDMLLRESSGINRRITSEDILTIDNRPVLLISSEFSRPGYVMAKWHGKRMVFNTSAGCVYIQMSYGYRNRKEEDKRELILKNLIESIKMN